jgi:hypothetical protein
MSRPLSLILALILAAPGLAAPTEKTSPTQGSSETQQTYSFRSSRAAGSIDRVGAVLEVGGEAKYTKEGQIERPKMSVVANLLYDERTLEIPTTSAGCYRSLRFYDRADAVIKVADDGLKPALREERRLIGVKVDGSKATLFSPRGSLSRDELDLVDVLGNSLLVDGFLPERPVAKGESWTHRNSLVAAMLGLDELKTSDVRSTLGEVNDSSALIDMAGRVEGAVDGVTTRIEIKAKYRFNRKTGRIDWFGLLVREDRDVGHVAQGLDVVARLKIQIEPRERSERLADAAIEGLDLEPTDAATRLTCESAEGGWRFAHDRRWYLVTSQRDLTVLRMIDRGELVAQCNIAPLPRVETGKQATLEQFQNDVKEALGKEFGQFVKASQRADEKKHRVLHVVAQGVVSELPIQWHYYLIANEQGEQIVFTFTVEASLAERLGQSDRDVVDSFTFLDRDVAMK